MTEFIYKYDIHKLWLVRDTATGHKLRGKNGVNINVEETVPIYKMVNKTYCSNYQGTSDYIKIYTILSPKG